LPAFLGSLKLLNLLNAGSPPWAEENRTSSGKSTGPTN
jgi:hypothetical protein